MKIRLVQILFTFVLTGYSSLFAAEGDDLRRFRAYTVEQEAQKMKLPEQLQSPQPEQTTENRRTYLSPYEGTSTIPAAASPPPIPPSNFVQIQPGER